MSAFTTRRHGGTKEHGEQFFNNAHSNDYVRVFSVNRFGGSGEIGTGTIANRWNVISGREQPADLHELSARVIGACIEVHRHLGPGLLEAVYEECLCEELTLQRISFERQVSIPVIYKGRELPGTRYRVDLVVDQSIIVELKSVETLLAVHKAQVLTQLKLTGLQIGLLINFFVPRLTEGVKRIVNGPNLAITRQS